MTTQSWQAIPHTRRVGAYLFFAVCAFGNSLVIYAPLRILGLPHWIISNAACIAMIGTFLALRDMTARPLPASPLNPSTESVGVAK